LAKPQQPEALTFVKPALDALNVGVWSWVGSPEHVRCCPVIARLFGVAAIGSADGQPLEAFVAAIHPADRGRFRSLVDRVMLAGGQFAAEYRIQPSPTSERWVLDLGQFEVGTGDSPSMACGIVIDITERLARDAIETDLSALNEPNENSILEQAANQALALHELIAGLQAETSAELQLLMRQMLLLLGREIARDLQRQDAPSGRRLN
jgi:hypothetical protein